MKRIEPPPSRNYTIAFFTFSVPSDRRISPPSPLSLIIIKCCCLFLLQKTSVVYHPSCRSIGSPLPARSVPGHVERNQCPLEPEEKETTIYSRASSSFLYLGLDLESIMSLLPFCRCQVRRFFSEVSLSLPFCILSRTKCKR